MTAKRWFIMLIIVVLLIATLIGALNIIVDPFAVFGGGRFDWYSYGMTNNPKTAKFAYIDARVGEFDAFVVGPSGASGFSPAVLEQHTGLRWYNMFNYGADMEYTRRLATYLIETHQPSMLLLVVPIISASQYEMPIETINYRQPLRSFWRVPFLFANPEFSINKIRNHNARGYLQPYFDVFNSDTGTYDKSVRDAEAIGCLDEYLEAYHAFVDMYFSHVPLNYIDENVAAVADILAVAEQNGVEVIIATTPMVHAEMGAFDHSEILEFYEKLADASNGFWDFTFSAISGDVRYFYDQTHFRNSVGEMMIARMFGDDSIWIPDDLGIFVTSNNAAQIATQFSTFSPQYQGFNETNIPILLYHDITDDDVPPALFVAHMSALYNAGFTAISLAQLNDFVFRGIELPPNPIIITFDDGYLSNYVYAFPVLQRYNFPATIFPMGISFGRDTHLGSGRPIRPRFGETEARRMIDSGLISLQSHTFDMHNVEGFDPSPIRRGILKMDGECEFDYVNLLQSDVARMRALLEPITGEEVFALSYPFGFHDTLSAVALRNAGISMTFSSNFGHATIVKGIPQSLLEMNRISVHGEMDVDELLWIIESF